MATMFVADLEKGGDYIILNADHVLSVEGNPDCPDGGDERTIITMSNGSRVAVWTCADDVDSRIAQAEYQKDRAAEEMRADVREQERKDRESYG